MLLAYQTLWPVAFPTTETSEPSSARFCPVFVNTVTTGGVVSEDPEEVVLMTGA